MDDLDQILSQYRRKLATIAQLWSSLYTYGQNDADMLDDCQGMIEALESAIGTLMSNRIRVLEIRQTILYLKQNLTISQLAVDAKNRQLDDEEEDQAKEKQRRLKQLQSTHKLDSERLVLEQKVATARKTLTKLKEAIDDKAERLRYLEDFHQWLLAFTVSDVQTLREDRELARQERGVWDKADLDVSMVVRNSEVNQEKVKALKETVQKLKQKVHNYHAWHDEELQSKLFHYTRSNMIKRRTEQLEAMHQGLEKVGQCQCQTSPMTKMEELLMGGIPVRLPRDVRDMLVEEFGLRFTISISIDTMNIPRFTHMVGEMGLAYLLDRRKEQNCQEHHCLPLPVTSSIPNRRAIEYHPPTRNRQQVESTPSQTKALRPLIETSLRPLHAPSTIRPMDRARFLEGGSMSEMSTDSHDSDTSKRSSLSRLRKMLKL